MIRMKLRKMIALSLARMLCMALLSPTVGMPSAVAGTVSGGFAEPAAACAVRDDRAADGEKNGLERNREMADTPLWTDKKRWLFGLPWTVTRYTLTETCLFIRSGVFTVREEEIRLYRVQDVSLRRSFGERICGLGTLHLCTSDKSSPEMDIRRVKNPKMVRTVLSDRAEAERSMKLESMREMLGGTERSPFHDGE